VTSMLSTAHASAYDALPEDHPAGSPADPGRSSVDKALELLEILVDHPRGEATLSELAAQVGLPKSTVHRLVTELCQHGLAGRVGVKYCPGLKLAELSVRTQWSEHRELLTIATPVLEWLFEHADGTTVQLGVLRGLDVVYLEKLSGAGGSRIPSRVGARLPASCTGIGKALLAASGYADILAQRRTPAPLPALTPYSVRDPRILATQLRQAQHTGISHDNGESHIGVRCIAAPVIIRDRPIAALSISVYGTTTKLDRFTPWLHDAATRIARDLTAGHTP
jgi:DNA-binding IclR family transcriptional regulator